MEVDPAHRRDREQIGGEDLAVGRGDEQVRVEAPDQFERRRGVDVLRLLDAEFLGPARLP